jgi:hypothetical protein
MTTDTPATSEATDTVTAAQQRVSAAWRELQDANGDLEAARQIALDLGHTEEQVQAAQDAGAQSDS